MRTHWGKEGVPGRGNWKGLDEWPFLGITEQGPDPKGGEPKTEGKLPRNTLQFRKLILTQGKIRTGKPLMRPLSVPRKEPVKTMTTELKVGVLVGQVVLLCPLSLRMGSGASTPRVCLEGFPSTLI